MMLNNNNWKHKANFSVIGVIFECERQDLNIIILLWLLFAHL